MCIVSINANSGDYVMSVSEHTRSSKEMCSVLKINWKKNRSPIYPFGLLHKGYWHLNV